MGPKKAVDTLPTNYKCHIIYTEIIKLQIKSKYFIEFCYAAVQSILLYVKFQSADGINQQIMRVLNDFTFDGKVSFVPVSCSA